MTKLKLGAIVDDKPVKLTCRPAGSSVHRDLVAYAEILARETVVSPVGDPAEVDCADAGAIHGDGPCLRKSKTLVSQAADERDSARPQQL